MDRVQFWTEAVNAAAGRPILVDLYPCQGGAAKGYQDSGFYVIGVDFVSQPRYCGDQLIVSDAISWLYDNLQFIGDAVAFIHASPPCQRYSATQRIQKNNHPDLIAPTREAMVASGVPGVIENVEDARSEMRDPVMLCGADFGIHTYRHRLFETIGWKMSEPVHRDHLHTAVKMGRRVVPGDWYIAVGNFSGVAYVRQDLGVGWMNRDGIRECIPPVYTRHVAGQFFARNP